MLIQTFFSGPRDSRGRVVLVDRDGVINVNRPSGVTGWSEFEFLPRSLDGLALLTRGGWAVVVVTNQANVNRGILSESTLFELHDCMVDSVRQAGGQVTAVLACPHRPDEGCDCRKPAPGLLREAARITGVELTSCVVIGDHWTDLAAARAAGCPFVLVLSGRVNRTDVHRSRIRPDAVVADLFDAANILVSGDLDAPSNLTSVSCAQC